VLGILTANRRPTPRWPGFARQELHRRVSLLAMVFLGLHVLTSVVDTYVHIGWVAVVVPFVSPYQRAWVAVGTISLDLLVAVAVSSWLRHRIPARVWRAVHWLAYASWPLALAHAFGMGTDMHQGWVVDLAVTCIVAGVAAGAWRLALAGSRTRRALAVAPVRGRPDGGPVKHLPG